MFGSLTCLSEEGKRQADWILTKYATPRSLTFLLQSLRSRCRLFRQEGNMVIFEKDYPDAGA